jgi:hypothetical protein
VSLRRRSSAISGSAAVVAVAVAGCGHGQASSTTGALPAGWGLLHTAAGAALPYPPGWHRVSGDPGTASAELLDRNGVVRAYLNVTPADPNEQLHSWAHFRIGHNGEEGDRNVRLISATTTVARREACVTDQYSTTKTSYRELACLVRPAHGQGTVLIAAAQPSAWPSERAALQYAINHFKN